MEKEIYEPEKELIGTLAWGEKTNFLEELRYYPKINKTDIIDIDVITKGYCRIPYAYITCVYIGVYGE